MPKVGAPVPEIDLKGNTYLEHQTIWVSDHLEIPDSCVG